MPSVMPTTFAARHAMSTTTSLKSRTSSATRVANVQRTETRASAANAREDARRRGPLEKSNLFSAKYVPFSGDSSETYSLDEVIY